MSKSSPYGPQMTTSAKRWLMKDRYYLMVGPLILVLGVSGASSEPSSVFLTWTAAVVLGALTLNRIIP